MRANVFKELLLYRYRYFFGYSILIVLSVGLTAWQLGDIPPGFSDLERESAVASNALSHTSATFVNLPYHLLQKGTLELFGISALGVRLPSVILALFVAAAAYFLLRRWFGESTAVIGTVLVVTSAHFLIRARAGNPLILYYLWPALLLLMASLANLQGKAWRLWIWLFAIIAGLSMYTPYLGFLIAIILLAVIASRQGRGLISEIGSPVAMLSGTVFLALLIPLGWSVYLNPGAILAYVGFIDAPSVSFVLERLKEMTRTLIDIKIDKNQPFAPVLSIPAIALGLYGLYYSLKSAARPRYAIISLWLFTSVAIFLSVDSAPIAIVFIPISLIIITGLYQFIRQWYKIFPRNPYARLAALVPIALLLVVMVQFNYNRYFYGIPRSENVRTVYSEDALILDKRLSQDSTLQNATVVVSKEQKPFFSLLTKHYPNLQITDMASMATPNAPLIVAREQQSTLGTQQRSMSLIVDDRPGNDALRFRVYQ